MCAVHREPVAVEVVARRVEDDEVETSGRPVPHPVALRVRAPEERVVERVEVGPLRNGGSLPVERPVRAPDVLLQARGRLERRAVPDDPEALVVAAHLALRRDAARRLRHRLRPGPHGQPRPERRVHAIAEVLVQVPGLEVLEDVREVHVRAAVEVRARPEVDEPERLEVDDPLRAERVPLRRREAEEELRAVRDQVGARDTRGRRHLLRQALPAVHLAGEALADARHGERAFQAVGDLRRRRPDVLLVVAAEEEGDVVGLEQRLVRVARKADRVDQRALLRPAVERQVHVRGVRNVRPEVRQAPRDRDREPVGRAGIVGIELRQDG